MAAAKKSSSSVLGGVLIFLGSLVYLYVVFTWYNSGAASSGWLTMAQFFGPFVIAAAIVSVISLFFMSIGAMMDKATGEMKSMLHMVLWRFVMISGIATIILTGGTGWFYVAIAAFILTYIGAMAASM